MKDKVLIIENNKEIKCDLLFTINDEKNNAKYVICTDNTKDEKGNVKVYFAKYEGNKIIPVSNKEKEELEKIVNLVQEEVCGNEN